MEGGEGRGSGNRQGETRFRAAPPRSSVQRDRLGPAAQLVRGAMLPPQRNERRSSAAIGPPTEGESFYSDAGNGFGSEL